MSDNSSNNQDLKSAGACKPGRSEWSSTESSGGGYDDIDIDEYIMSKESNFLSVCWKSGQGTEKSLSFFSAATFERYLAGCPDIPNLKNLIASDEELKRVATSNLEDSSSGMTSEEYFAKMDRGKRCSIFMGRRTRDGNKIVASEVPFFEKYTGDCPNAPSFKDLSEKKKGSLGEYFMGMKQESRCWTFKVLREKVLREKEDLNASQKAYFKKWLGDCPNVPDLS